MTFIKMVLAVFAGTIMASGAAVALLFNNRFIVWYTKRLAKLSEKISEELYEMDD